MTVYHAVHMHIQSNHYVGLLLHDKHLHKTRNLKLFAFIRIKEQNKCSEKNGFYQVQHYQMDLNNRFYLDQRLAVQWSLSLLLAVVVHFLDIHTINNSRRFRPHNLQFHRILLFHQHKHHNHIEIQTVDNTSMHNIQQFRHLNLGILIWFFKR